MELRAFQRRFLRRASAPGLRFVVCDRFRLSDLLDAFGGRATVTPRVTRWSEAAADIRAARQLALDGNLSVEPSSRACCSALDLLMPGLIEAVPFPCDTRARGGAYGCNFDVSAIQRSGERLRGRA